MNGQLLRPIRWSRGNSLLLLRCLRFLLGPNVSARRQLVGSDNGANDSCRMPVLAIQRLPGMLYAFAAFAA